MNLKEQIRLPLAPKDAWKALNDIGVLQACIPGCQSLQAIAKDAFAVTIAVPVGITELTFHGRIRLCDVNYPHSYTLRFDDNAGQSRAEAQVRLESIGQSETLLHYTANVALGGAIGHFGDPLWTRIAQLLADKFFQSFRERTA